MKAVAALKPGDRLELASGTYSVDRMWDIGVSGTAKAPIWIVAAKDAQVIITRPDGNQNVIHNTIVNANHAFRGGSWNACDGMILANNILCSRDANALHFASGKEGVTIASKTSQSSLGMPSNTTPHPPWTLLLRKPIPGFSSIPTSKAEPEPRLSAEPSFAEQAPMLQNPLPKQNPDAASQ